jgi:hypothetical protein
MNGCSDHRVSKIVTGVTLYIIERILLEKEEAWHGLCQLFLKNCRVNRIRVLTRANKEHVQCVLEENNEHDPINKTAEYVLKTIKMHCGAP